MQDKERFSAGSSRPLYTSWTEREGGVVPYGTVGCVECTCTLIDNTQDSGVCVRVRARAFACVRVCVSCLLYTSDAADER